MDYQTLLVNIDSGIAYVTLHRPDKRNAMNNHMIEELGHVFTNCQNDQGTRVIVLTGTGNTFCAGADLHDMQSATQSPDYAKQMGLQLGKMLQCINQCSRPVIAMVNGPAMGGGMGLVCVADIVLASSQVNFSFPEVHLGLVPAVISPFVIQRIGAIQTRRFFLTGEPFSAKAALMLGLVTEVSAPEQLNEVCQTYARHLLAGGPQALAECKRLIHYVTANGIEKNLKYTPEIFVKMLDSVEAKEGIQAFHEKRSPNWYKNS
ncbi:MAG: enoyl-CoA hydratase/isomerase family protein [SAR324 cluster bacterium]|nr:enoyl-CoA hydratase/isomerase family protein [SAR324 cluster bacterium]